MNNHYSVYALRLFDRIIGLYDTLDLALKALKAKHKALEENPGLAIVLGARENSYSITEERVYE